MNYPLYKLATAIEMSFDISDKDREIAEASRQYFEGTKSSLNSFAEHLNVVYDPFSDDQDLPIDSVVQYRGLLRRFTTKAIENYKEVQIRSVKAIQRLSYFSKGDSDTEEIVKSFSDTIDSLSDQFSELIKLLTVNFRTPSFKDKVLQTIDSIRKDIKEALNFIDDRAINHIDANILAKDWYQETSKELQVAVDEGAPAITRLYEERQKMLNSGMPGSNQPPQSMNPSDAQKMHYPDAITQMPGDLGGLK